jgi:dipeptidyl aminopeptidase/acylaminoacyl peptidase
MPTPVSLVGLLPGVLSVLAGLVPVAAQARALMPEDWHRFRDLSDLKIAPDGSALAYLVTTYDRQSDESRGALWLTDWAGRESVQLTRGASAAEPRFSPDGRSLSFLSARPAGGATQLWLLDRHGGKPRQLSHCDGEITGYEWSPDGRHIVVVMHAPEARSPQPIVIDSYLFKDKLIYLTAQRRAHLYLLEVGDGACHALATDPERADSSPAFSPDGRQIAYVSQATQTPRVAGIDEIDVVPAALGSKPRRLASTWTPAEDQRLEWSPDGSLVAFLQGDDPKADIGMLHLAVVEVASGQVHELSASLDRSTVSPQFALDGRSLVVAVEDDGIQYPARLTLDSGAVERLAGPTVVTEIATAAGHTAVLASDDHSPFEVYALEAGKLRPLTTHNQSLFAELSLGSVTDISFRSRDGTEIHGQIVKPPDYVAGRRYPTILWMHGGPDGQDDHSLLLEGYGPQLDRQLFATHGYVVLAINYRGSTGRGAGFARSINRDWGHKEVEDVLAGVDYAIAQGIADPNRLGVGGWSYGGVLTDCVIASDTRFKAAISGAGIGNEIASYGTDPWVVSYDAELGPPWRDTQLWLKLSYPFLHADRITTPTLFVGGENDFNVPISGSEQMYQALKSLGVPARLVVYPGEGHVLERPSFLVDLYRRYLEWMEKYLGGGS